MPRITAVNGLHSDFFDSVGVLIPDMIDGVCCVVFTFRDFLVCRASPKRQKTPWTTGQIRQREGLGMRLAT